MSLIDPKDDRPESSQIPFSARSSRFGHQRLSRRDVPPKETDEEVLKRFETGHNQMFPDDPQDVRHKTAMLTKETSKYYDPCKLTAQMSLNCLHRNRYNNKKAREFCKEYFDAYKECKAEWQAERRNRD